VTAGIDFFISSLDNSVLADEVGHAGRKLHDEEIGDSYLVQPAQCAVRVDKEIEGQAVVPAKAPMRLR